MTVFSSCIKFLSSKFGVGSDFLIASRWIGSHTLCWPDLKLFILVGWDRRSFVCCLVHRDSTDDLLLFQISRGVVWQSRDLQMSRKTLYLLSPRLCFFVVLNRDLFVYRDDSLSSQRVIMRTEQPTKCFVPLQKLRARLAP